MAALHYATATTTSLHHRCRRFTSETLNHRRPTLSIFAALPAAKPPRRKNHLRQKILKTLKNPIIPNLPPANPVTPINSPPLQEIEESCAIQELVESDKYENSEAENGEGEKLEELREAEVQSAAASFDGNVGIITKNQILKYGLWLVGAFVFQTVCAIWVFGSSGIDTENESLNGTRKKSLLGDRENREGKPRVKLFLNVNGNEKMGVKIGEVESIGYLDELKMERKIEEIRVMAREAREKERLESKKNSLDSEEIDEGKYPKSGIEEEVDNKLIKLRNKLKNLRDKMPMASVGYSKKDNTVLDEKDSNGALLFKKKYKFKGVSGDSVEKPKGFIGSDDTRVKIGNLEKSDELIKSTNGDDNGAVDILDVDSKGSDAVRLVEEDKKKFVSEINESTRKTRKNVAKEKGISKQEKAKGFGQTKGVAPEKKNGRKLNAEAVKPRKSNEIFSANASLKGEGDAKLAIKNGDSETDLWWSNLPYVLVIIMRRGYDGEGGEGFYTLKSISKTTEDQTSHIVAFEDRSDATNFCYLLQSFFEDLQDFIADAVPLTVKELNEAVKSRTARVIVVKKGQLRLYAGQPLADAEVALRAMIKKI